MDNRHRDRNAQRRRAARELRRSGYSYSEIARSITVSKSTLSVWCRDIDLTTDQQSALRERTGPQARTGTRVDTQWRRHLEIDQIRADSIEYMYTAIGDPVFVSGVSLYWAEGSKTRNDLSITNSDPRLLRLFVRFVRRHLDPDATFALALNLHDPAGEARARRYWRAELHLPDARFTKSYIKKPGTGHRRKKLPHGICRIRVDKASNHWHRVMQWIDELEPQLGS